MPDSGGSKRFEAVTASGFGALAILGALLLIYFVGALNGEQAERRDNYPHTHSESAKQKAERACVGANATAVFECVVSYVEASENTVYAEQDLTAQQRAAWGSLIAACAGLLSVAVSLLGLYWIKGTLDATRDAVGQTTIATNAMVRQNDLAEAAQRPWVSIDCEVSELERKGGVLIVKYALCFTNQGKMAARNFSVKTGTNFALEESVDKASQWLFGYFNSRREETRHVILPGETQKFEGVVHQRIDMLTLKSDLSQNFTIFSSLELLSINLAII